jgi:hypothetical protein
MGCPELPDDLKERVMSDWYEELWHRMHVRHTRESGLFCHLLMCFHTVPALEYWEETWTMEVEDLHGWTDDVLDMDDDEYDAYKAAVPIMGTVVEQCEDRQWALERDDLVGWDLVNRMAFILAKKPFCYFRQNMRELLAYRC